MRRVVSVEPIFVVSNVSRAVAHYEQLGFTTSHHDEGYAFAHRNELTIHFVQSVDEVLLLALLPGAKPSGDHKRDRRVQPRVQ